MQTSLAEASRALRAAPRSPSGWKKSELSTPRQAAISCQSHRSALGPGRREKSAMGDPLGSVPVWWFRCGDAMPCRADDGTSTVKADENMTHSESILTIQQNGRNSGK